MKLNLGSQLGNYQLIKSLGSGGFAYVYLGKHIYLETMAAVKVLRIGIELSDKERRQFLTEARTIAQLRHPHIIGVLDFGVEHDLPYFVMEYAAHGSLRDRHTAGSVVPLDTILSYVQQVASALQYAHERQVVHCDVKPENMLVGEDGGVLLGDFGIARVMQNTTQTQDVMGTVAYMAPERFTGKSVPASDQYALGVVVYQWLCGDLPFDGRNAAHVLYMHTYMQPPSLCERMPGLPPAVEKVVFRALMKQEDQRFPSIQAFADAFEDAVKARMPVNAAGSQASRLFDYPAFHQEDHATIASMAPTVLNADITDQEHREEKAFTVDNAPGAEKIFLLLPLASEVIPPPDNASPVPFQEIDNVPTVKDEGQLELVMPTVYATNEDETVLASPQDVFPTIPLFSPVHLPSIEETIQDETVLAEGDPLLSSFSPLDDGSLLSIRLLPTISEVISRIPVPPPIDPQQIEIFISYSHRDRKYREELDIFLEHLRRIYPTTVWYDGEILPGEDFEREIERHLHRAHIILLLVSQFFIASRYCREKELKPAIQRHIAGEARVIPVIVRPATWRDDEILGRLQALPKYGKPIVEWQSKDAAYLNVAQGLRRVIKEMLKIP